MEFPNTNPTTLISTVNDKKLINITIYNTSIVGSVKTKKCSMQKAEHIYGMLKEKKNQKYRT